MSKHSNNWINKVREELINYSPEYNASDWEALKGNLPKPKTTSFWTKSKLNLWKGILLISGIAAITLVLLKTLEKPTVVVSESATEHILSDTSVSRNSGKTNNDTPELISNQTPSDTSKEYSVQYSQAGQTNTQQEPANNNTVKANAELEHKATILKSTGSAIVETNTPEIRETKESFVIKELNDNEIKQPLSKDSTKQHSPPREEKKELNISQTKDFQQKQDAVVNKQEAQKIKLRGKKSKHSKKKRKSNGQNIYNTGKKKVTGIKTKKIKTKQPFYYGLNSSLNHYNVSPYNATLKFSGGFTFERFISPRSSVEIAPKLHGGKFQFTETKTTYDTTMVTQQTIVDSIPVTEEHLNITENNSQTQHSTNLLYLDIPIYYNLYFTNSKTTSTGISLGLSNKYLLSYKTDSDEIPLSQKLHIAQAGIIQLNYRRELNKKLHLRVSPFAEIPLQSSPEKIMNKTFYGIRFDLLFKVN